MKFTVIDLSPEDQLHVRAMELAAATSLTTMQYAEALLRSGRAPAATLAKAQDICRRAGARSRILQAALDRVAKRFETT
jgi:hypothetical protein